MESIPEHLSYRPNSQLHLSTYKAWMQLLGAATATVDIASYYWTLRGHGNITDVTDKQGWMVYNELAGLSKRGVKLRIVQNFPSEVYPDLDTLDLTKEKLADVQNINFTKLEGAGILHTKLWVADKKHFYVGSANMDWRSLTQVKELGLLGIDCECLAQDAQKLFNIYWYLSSPGAVIPPTWSADYTAMFNMEDPASISINNTAPVDIYWASSPPSFCAHQRTQDLDALLTVINTADKFVYIAVMDYFPAVIYGRPKYFWPTFDDALRSAAYDRGVHVRVMGSYWNHTSKDMVRFLQSLSASNGTGPYQGIIETSLFIVPPLPDRSIPFTRVNHKYMVSDKAAYISTSNWSGDYFLYTGGVSCIVNQTTGNHGNDANIQADLVKTFERDWYSDYNRILL
ncbi:5'-3' exonuclease PLD3-like isoform X2 [Halichondria panicea]|uniref:5'-3' exonuclease PLD3-like isoform X2 n=1 Tax=Halichondria panicea TaxID=6063 RepID=UPI00312B377F